MGCGSRGTGATPARWPTGPTDYYDHEIHEVHERGRDPGQKKQTAPSGPHLAYGCAMPRGRGTSGQAGLGVRSRRGRQQRVPRHLSPGLPPRATTDTVPSGLNGATPEPPEEVAARWVGARSASSACGGQRQHRGRGRPRPGEAPGQRPTARQDPSLRSGWQRCLPASGAGESWSAETPTSAPARSRRCPPRTPPCGRGERCRRCSRM